MRLLAPLVAASLLAACGGSDGGSSPIPEPSDVGEVAADELRFEGDPQSPFCIRTRAAGAAPLADPFEAGQSPAEVRSRFRALHARLRDFAAVAPEELSDDIARMVEAFGELAQVLDDAGYDFAVLAETEVDLTVFDDPDFARVTARVDAYQSQVCTPGG